MEDIIPYLIGAWLGFFLHDPIMKFWAWLNHKLDEWANI